MKKTVFQFSSYLGYLLLFLFFMANTPTQSQESSFNFQPRQLTVDINANGMWQMDEGVSGQWVDELRLRSQLYLKNHLSLVVEDKVSFSPNTSTTNNLSKGYLQYSNALSHNGWLPIFRHRTYVNIQTGKMEWYPQYRDIRLMSENFEKFRNPTSFYGVSYRIGMPLVKDRWLKLTMSGHFGDWGNDGVPSRLRNIYLDFRKDFVKNFGLATRGGKMENSRYWINFSYLYYTPTIEKIQLGFRVGKLLSLDDIPYGTEIRMEREFKYIAIGGYFQQRINQKSHFEQTGGESQIFGFTWRIIAPKKLKNIFNSYQFIYDTNTNTLRFVIPFMLTNFYYD